MQPRTSIAGIGNGTSAPASAGETGHAAAPSSGGRLNLNTATEKELEALPGIGPELAKRIVAGRPYRRVEELGRVKGIGVERVEKLRPYFE